MVTKKGTPVKKTKDVKIAANVMADLIKTEEKAKAEVQTEIKPQTKQKINFEYVNLLSIRVAYRQHFSQFDNLKSEDL